MANECLASYTENCAWHLQQCNYKLLPSCSYLHFSCLASKLSSLHKSSNHDTSFITKPSSFYSPCGMLCGFASIGWCRTQNNILSLSMLVVFTLPAFIFIWFQPKHGLHEVYPIYKDVLPLLSLLCQVRWQQKHRTEMMEERRKEGIRQMTQLVKILRKRAAQAVETSLVPSTAKPLDQQTK